MKGGKEGEGNVYVCPRLSKGTIEVGGSEAVPKCPNICDVLDELASLKSIRRDYLGLLGDRLFW